MDCLHEDNTRVHLEHLGVGGRIILKWILKKWSRLEGKD
jgi:hypothetical protein